MQQFNEIDYLLIQFANEAGMDKHTYEERIEWSKENLNQETSPLGFKTKLAIDKVKKGVKHGCPVYFDAIASGIQILSAVTACEAGCKATGLIDTGVRPNPYRLIADKVGVDVPYEDCKQAVMTYFYGSRAVPKQVFGDKLNNFKEACMETFPNAYSLINFLVQTWNSKAYAHEWTMPDGFKVYIPVLQKEMFEVSIAGYEPMKVISTVNKPMSKGLANAANIAHSLDGYVMRTLIRYCSYDPKTIETKLKKVEAELAKRTEEESVYFGDITESNYKTMSTGQLIGQYLDLSDMLLYKPFDVITVHDNFGCHPKHMNRLRYWYNQIMSRMSTNKYLDSIVSQLVREDIEIDLPRASVAGEIQKANYAIC